MKIRLFIDEDAMADALVTGLRACGIDVLTAGEEARRKIEDDEQLEFAASQAGSFILSTPPIFTGSIPNG